LNALTKQELIVLIRGAQAAKGLMETLLFTAKESIFKFKGQFLKLSLEKQIDFGWVFRNTMLILINYLGEII
jgi:hypothetical protein